MDFPARIRSRVAIEAVYTPHVEREYKERDRIDHDSALLPLDLDYDAIPGLSMAGKGVLKATRPESIAQAGRVEGVTPTGCLRWLSYVRREGAGSGATTANTSRGEGLLEELSSLIGKGEEDMEALDASARASEL
jgi:hypothetical protein